MMKIEHIAMYVQDLEKTRDFFVKYFAAKSNAMYHNLNTDFKSYFLSFDDGARLEIMQKPGVEAQTENQMRTGFIHVAISVGSKEQVDKLTETLKQDGYTVTSGPRTTGDGYYESCVVAVEENLIEFTMRLVDNFEKLAMIRLESKKEYINKLLLHIRPMYYRLKYGIKIHNILNQEIQEKYTMFFHLTKKAIELTDQKYFNELSDDEVSYLCIYFAGWMNQNVSEIGKEDAPYKILLVVSDGNSTSSLIQLQLVNLLKPLHFSYDVVSSRQFMSSMAEKYALVVGDIPRENTFSHVIPVSAILTESQRNRILQWSIRFSNMNNDDDLTRLYDIIQMHCTIHDEEILKVKLFSFLNENSGTESSQIPSLLQIMKVNDLFLFSEKMDIDQILFVMSRDFVIKKIVKALYPVNILHLLQTMGAYGEISKGVLLLHAEDVSYCNGLGIRIGNLEYPLRLSGNPHEIHTIILLSTPDKLKHLRILKNLSQLFRNADFLNRLEKGMFSTKEQMYKKIAQILSTEE